MFRDIARFTVLVILTTSAFPQSLPGNLRLPSRNNNGSGGVMRKTNAPTSAELQEANNVSKFPDTCEIPQQQAFPSELKYYQNFHPSDSLFDFWCKVQMLNGSGKFVAQIGENNSYHLMHSEPFTFDGTPHSSRRYLAKLLTEAMQLYISGERTRESINTPMSTFGFPPTSAEGQRSIYHRSLKLTFEGIEVAGTPFSVIGFFDITQGAIARWLKGDEIPLEFAVRFRTGVLSHDIIVAFPVVFRALLLATDDPKLQYSRSDILAMLNTKYGRFQTKPGVYTDRSNGVVVDEGDSRGRRFLKISYAPSDNGPLDPKRGDELEKLAKAAMDRGTAKDKADVEGGKTKNPL